MTADTNSGLLVKLSLEAVKRRQLRGQFVITELRRGDRSSDQNGACRVAECSGDPDLIAEALTEQREHPRTGPKPVQDVVSPGIRLENRNRVHRNEVHQG